MPTTISILDILAPAFRLLQAGVGVLGLVILGGVIVDAAVGAWVQRRRR